MKKRKALMRIDLQCGSCGSLCHQGEKGPRFCPCCGAGFDRYCLSCKTKVDMFFEEWWPEDNECVRTYSPAKRCPQCNARLEVELKAGMRSDSAYEH
jgi:hypothetical protein